MWAQLSSGLACTVSCDSVPLSETGSQRCASQSVTAPAGPTEQAEPAGSGGKKPITIDDTQITLVAPGCATSNDLTTYVGGLFLEEITLVGRRSPWARTSPMARPPSRVTSVRKLPRRRFQLAGRRPPLHRPDSYLRPKRFIGDVERTETRF